MIDGFMFGVGAVLGVAVTIATAWFVWAWFAYGR